MFQKPVLRFDEWCGLVCGSYRVAQESTLKDLWVKNWSPYRATEYLQRERKFERRRKDSVPFWESWKDEGPLRKARRRAIGGFELRCRIAEAILEAIGAAREHRLDESELQFCAHLERQCRAQLADRKRRREENKARREKSEQETGEPDA